MTPDAKHALGAPPDLPNGGLRVVALGGIKEIGRNMTMFEFDGRLLIVDCGMLLGKTNSPGIDITLPDWSYYSDSLEDIDAVVLTHGHEDHIGALPYLLRERKDIPIYGSRLTLALVAAKLEQHRIKADLRTVAEGERTDVGPWGLEFFAVNHSIPDALAVGHPGRRPDRPAHRRLQDGPDAARRPAHRPARVLPPRRRGRRPAAVGLHQRRGRRVHPVRARCRPRSSPTSSTRRRAASSSPASPRTCTACSRCSTPRSTAGRQVAFVGRSMVRNMQIARDLGLLRVPDGLLVDLKMLDELPSRRVLLVSTGSQGEPLSALSRMANRDHQTIRIGADDTILLASSLIPGNETSVGQVINGLSRLGATVVHKSMALVHVSGHAPAGELRYLLTAVRPTNLMPVHGEWRHLRAHAAIGRSMGLTDERIMLAEDGTVVDLVGGLATIVGKIPVGYVYVDGLEVGDVGDSTLKDRRILGEDGFLSILVAVDLEAGKVVFGPEITARGFSDDPAALDPIRAELIEVVEKALADGTRDAEALQNMVRRTVGRWVDREYRRRPMLVPMVVEV